MAARDHLHRGDVPTSKGHPRAKSYWLGFAWHGEKEVRPTARLSRSKSADAGSSRYLAFCQRLSRSWPHQRPHWRISVQTQLAVADKTSRNADLEAGLEASSS
jgi:hypothetical protein